MQKKIAKDVKDPSNVAEDAPSHIVLTSGSEVLSSNLICPLPNELAFLTRELEFMRRKSELMHRELNLTRRENELLRNTLVLKYLLERR